MTDDVALDVASEHEGQAAVDGEANAARPASGFGELLGDVFRPGAGVLL
ncbi:hypothetical protein [Streptomyces sp. NPDC059761]